MSRLTGRDAFGLIEAYNSVYAPQQVDEDQLASEIFEEIAYALISQGYTAIDVLEYFANVDEEVIIEDIVAIDERTLLIESAVSEEYIEEQMQQLDEYVGAALRLGGAALNAARFAPRGVGLGGRVMSALGGAGRAAQRISQQGTRASAVVRPALGRVVSNAKDLAKGALGKLPGGSSGKLASAAKTAGRWALAGAGFEAGMRGLGALMGGGDKTTSTKPSSEKNKEKYIASSKLGGQTAFSAGGGAEAMRRDSKLTAADIQRRGTAALRASAGGNLKKGAELFKAKQQILAGKKPSTPSTEPERESTPPTPEVTATNTLAAKPVQPQVKPTTPKSSQGYSIGTTASGTKFERRAATGAELAASRAAGGGEAGVRSAVERSTKLMGGPEGPGQIDTKSVEADIKAQQERDKKRAEQQSQPVGGRTRSQVLNQSYEYDAFDLVLEYLTSEGHVETVDEALYVMLEMDSETIQSICEAKKSKKWIQKAIKHPGALSKELEVPEEENIPAGKLKKAAKSKGKLGQRARLAMTLKGLKKGKTEKEY